MPHGLTLAGLLALLPKAFFFHFHRYVISAAAVYLVFYKTPWFQQRRFPGTSPHVSFRQFRREFGLSTLSCAIFGIGSVVAVEATLLGWTRLDLARPHYSVLYELATILALLVLFDAWFYLSHLALHRSKRVRRWHAGHHRSNPPSPWAALSFDAGETAFYSVFFVLVPFIFPMTLFTYQAVLWVVFLQSAIIHSVYEAYPSWWRMPMTNVYHHFLHHKRGRGNFGLYFIWLDQAFGTADKRYVGEPHPTVPGLGPRASAMPIDNGACR